MRKIMFAVLAALCLALPCMGQDPDSTAGPGAPSAQSPVPDCLHFKHYRDTLTGDRWESTGVPCSWVKPGGSGGYTGVTSDGANGLNLAGTTFAADGSKQTSAAYNTEAVTFAPKCPSGSTTCIQIYADAQVSNQGTSNSTTTVTCANCSFSSADVGKIFWATTNAHSSLYETVVCPQTAIASVTNSTTAVLNNACTANATANAIFYWGHDDGPTFASAFQDCRNYKIGASSSTYIITSKGFANTALACNNSVLTGVMGAPRASLIAEGYWASQTTFIMTPNFNWATCTGAADAEGNTFCFGRQLRSISNIQIHGDGLTPAANTNCANASGKAVIAVSGSGNMGGVDIAGICAGQTNLEGIVVAGQDNTLSEGGAQDVGQWACVFSQFDGESGIGNDCHNLDVGATGIGLRVTGGAKVFQFGNTPIYNTVIDGNSNLTSIKTSYVATTGATQAVTVASGSTFSSYGDNISGNGNTGLNLASGATAFMNGTAHAGSPSVASAGTLYSVASTYNGAANITAGTVNSQWNTFSGGTLTISSGAVHYGLNDTFSAVTVNSGGKLQLTNSTISSAFTNSGTLLDGGNNKIGAIPASTSGSTWQGQNVLMFGCSGTASANTTIYLYNLTNYTGNTAPPCTTTAPTAGNGYMVTRVPNSGSMNGLSCTAGTGGVNSSSGVATVLYDAGSAYTGGPIRVTFGTSTTPASDSSHYLVPAVLHEITMSVTTQVGETLANPICTLPAL